jgi:hypothetical protein
MSIGARVTKQLEKKGKVVHARLYGKEKGHAA